MNTFYAAIISFVCAIVAARCVSSVILEPPEGGRLLFLGTCLGHTYHATKGPMTPNVLCLVIRAAWSRAPAMRTQQQQQQCRLVPLFHNATHFLG